MTGLKEEEEKKKSSTNSTKKRKSIANIFVKSLAKKRIYVIFFCILGCWYCVEIKLVYLFYLSLCNFVLDSNVKICIILKLLNKY